MSLNKYRSPKIFNDSRKNDKPKFKLSSINFRLIFGIATVVSLVYYFFFSPQFKIKDIIVEGASVVNKSEVVAALPQGENIFLFNSEKNKDILLDKFPEIKQVEIYRGIPDALKIVVLEREGKILWASGSDKYLISVDGDVAKKLTETDNFNLPLVSDTKNLPVKTGSPLVSPNFVAFITNIYSTFYQETNIKPQNFEVTETTFDVNLKTEAGFYVKLNSLRSSQKQLDNLKLVLAEKRQDIHEYVDLRIDGWAYYK